VVRPAAATPAAGVVAPQAAAAVPSGPARPSVPPAAAPTQEKLREFEKGAVRVEGKIKVPRLIKKVEPVYPPGQSGGGVVILMIRVDEKGAVEDALVLRPVPGLNEAALAAVKQWLYEPLILDGLARKAVMTVTVNFIPRGGGTAEALAKLDQGAVRVQGELKPPDLLKKVEPVYPETARLAGVEGTVILAVRARVDGTVEDAIVLRSVPLLDQAAIDAVKQWIYAPFIVDGKAAPAVFTVTVNFKLK
jgi:TonB family protein